MIAVRQALYDAIAVFKLQDIQSAALDARILLSYTLGISQEQLLISLENKLSTQELSLFLHLLTRRLNYEPIAYITGYKEFYGFNFAVDKNVLIPRADTELLIDEVIALAASINNPINNNHISILELGTGSGCIALSLLNLLPNAKAVATDISDAALKLAAINAENLHLSSRVKFINSDWFTNIPNVQYDFIITNPPYISLSDVSLVAKETKLHEPLNALFAKDNGLNAYKQIAAFGKKFFQNHTKLLMEIGFNQAAIIGNIFRELGYKIEFIKCDLAGRDRIVCCSLTDYS